MKKNGARTWYFADGYLPEKVDSSAMEAHEALMLLNCGETPANIKLDFYFEDKAPTKNVSVMVQAERVRTLRLDHPEDIGGLVIPPLTQYSIRVRSDVDIVVQFGRLDTTQNNMSYYCGIGYCANELG